MISSTPASSTLTALLTRAGLEHLLPLFEEEDLTMPLLMSMGTQLRANLTDLALSPVEVEAVAEALFRRADGAEPYAGRAGPSGCCSERSAANCGASCHQAIAVSPDPLAGFRQRVADLQAELYADDLEPPAGAHAWSTGQLRHYYESGGESMLCVPAGPSQAAVDSCPSIWMEPEPAATSGTEPGQGGSCLGGHGGAAEEPIALGGPVVGTLRLRWQAHRSDFDFATDTTVGALKRWLHWRTGVPPARQRLLGLARRGEAAEEALLREPTLAPALTLAPTPALARRCCANRPRPQPHAPSRPTLPSLYPHHRSTPTTAPPPPPQPLSRCCCVS